MEVTMPEESKLAEKLEEKQSEVKFNEEELKQIQDTQLSYADVTSKFGQLSLAKLRVEQHQNAISKEYDTLVNTYNKIQEDEQKFLDGITEKYGQGTLNPETGVFTPNKSE
jgi:predicted nuclease with TOPRIM domain